MHLAYTLTYLKFSNPEHRTGLQNTTRFKQSFYATVSLHIQVHIIYNLLQIYTVRLCVL